MPQSHVFGASNRFTSSTDLYLAPSIFPSALIGFPSLLKKNGRCCQHHVSLHTLCVATHNVLRLGQKVKVWVHLKRASSYSCFLCLFISHMACGALPKGVLVRFVFTMTLFLSLSHKGQLQLTVALSTDSLT
ncbi:hypothetical protein ATANTOWER_028263 [Ataeniobius toweri]|uniref:Uncharacterized protein n=1 Tax=Ataeniobius toweri TaxID=208326 RepID=A0ABU7C7B8_9TELE|nr:hypothetical protein [Ataeniobius toweri]